MRDIAELPQDLFLLVISYLSPRTCVRCRAVSRRWHAAFTSELVSQLLLRWNFPRCREIRLGAAAAASIPLLSATLPRNVKAELVDVAQHQRDWSLTFAEVARRYFHLGQAQPRVVEKLETAVKSEENGSGVSFWGVAPWNRFLRLNNQTSSFHYPDPVWWYSQEDGVLVYPAAVDTGHAVPSSSYDDGHVYHIVDLSTGQRVPVPFDVRSKHIRRVRLAQGVLIFEWAEELPYHQLNTREVVHRHFVTAFDAIRKPSGVASGQRWTIEFRSEWKLHFLGLPLNFSDRFFSAHTATHYAVYFWQPNRSLYQDDPIEQLAVWDISSPSPYRPSQDPRGQERPIQSSTLTLPTGLWSGHNNNPEVGRLNAPEGSGSDSEGPRKASLVTATAGPQVIRRMAWRELDFYGLRQRATPQLRCLALDDRNLYVIEEEHRWAEGQHSSLNPPRVHLVRSTGIPIVPASAIESTPAALSTIVDGPVYGPIWVDTCGANGDVNMNFCPRVADANSAAGSATAHVARPDPQEGLPDTTDPDHLSNPPRPRPSATATGWPWALGGKRGTSLVASTESARWPGWAPCWRHEEFPYLTVTEMVDFAAGVRVTARHCFMLETMSAHVRPAVSIKGTPPATNLDDDGSVGSSKTNGRRRSSSARASSARSKEVLFPDDMWSQLVARGHIAGDERWVIGEDYKGRITVVRF
ncbi:hypothetical protein C8A03DRAFT_35178 [Achaetomium macrosporum]|uniref:F-box domain-containing protein n=1 Tax=Achaetomium macrosporum TaxID=79813 RepID=A0AAN7C8K2_9PEZI|nr:hypothetical protein C8A03DRAFT_35178 [Achaetomium macrosporum]